MSKPSTSFSFVKAAVEKRKTEQLYRQRQAITSNIGLVIELDGKHYLNFASNDYLGLGQQQDVLQSYVEGLSLHGAGSGASSLVSGYSVEHQALEQYICDKTGKQAALLFSSGFAANQAICHALFASGFANDKQGLIIADKLMHASFIEAASILETPFKRYKHNDSQHLKALLVGSSADTLVATEGVFSMDGDLAELDNLLPFIKPKCNNTAQPWLLVDDAHAIGVIGKNGMGTCDESNTQRSSVDILMGTFGKALGTSGAFVAGSQVFIDYLINFARHYIYSTAIPAANARATLTSFKLMNDTNVRELLQQNIRLFRSACELQSIPLNSSESAIQIIVLGTPDKALKSAECLKELGIWVGCIRTPTVPKHSDRLRITISAMHQEQDILALVDALNIVLTDLDGDGDADRAGS